MESHRDIYKQESKSEENKPLPAFEVPPTDVRSRTQRRIFFSLVLMAVLLGSVLAYVYRQEQLAKEKEKQAMLELQDATNGAARLRVPAGAITPMPAVDIAVESRDAPSDLPPQKVADAMAALRTANEYLQAREVDAAEEHVKRALAIWPSMNAGLRMLGWIYVQRGQVDQAVNVLERALKVDPFNPETYNNLAAAYMQKRMFEKAEDLLLTSLQIQPDLPMANMNLGLLYVMTGEYDHAQEYLEAALEQMPDNPIARNNLGVVLIRLGRYDEARSQFQYLIDNPPTTQAAYFNMAVAYTYERNLPEAIRWIKQGIAASSPTLVQRFLADTDFDSIRATPEFQALVKDLYPDVPSAPKAP